MKPTSLYNGCALGLAFVLSAAWTLRPHATVQSSQRPTDAIAAAAEMPTDSRGVRPPAKRYERILSASIVADAVLWQLCESTRIIAYTTRAIHHPLYGHRHRDKPGTEGLRQLEEVLALAPDLVIISHFADARHIARLEERGIAVFDLGQMQGMKSLGRNIGEIGALVGNPQGASRMTGALQRRLGAIAAAVPAEKRPRAVYVSAYGTKLFGGTRGTSYHDVLTGAGLVDAAAVNHRGWPELTAENMLSLDPDLVVTKRGMSAALCRYPGMTKARACQSPERIIEVTPILIDDPGPPMLESAEELFDLVYGRGGPYALAQAPH